MQLLITWLLSVCLLVNMCSARQFCRGLYGKKASRNRNQICWTILITDQTWSQRKCPPGMEKTQNQYACVHTPQGAKCKHECKGTNAIDPKEDDALAEDKWLWEESLRIVGKKHAYIEINKKTQASRPFTKDVAILTHYWPKTESGKEEYGMYGTAFFITNRVAITTTHCQVDFMNNPRHPRFNGIENSRITPGWAGGANPEGAWKKGLKILDVIVNEWVFRIGSAEQIKEHFEIAILLIEPHKREFPVFTLDLYPTDESKKQQLKMSGFPGPLNGVHVFYEGNQLQPAIPGPADRWKDGPNFKYIIAVTSGGSSGSPIYISSDKSYAKVAAAVGLLEGGVTHHIEQKDVAHHKKKQAWKAGSVQLVSRVVPFSVQKIQWIGSVLFRLYTEIYPRGGKPQQKYYDSLKGMTMRRIVGQKNIEQLNVGVKGKQQHYDPSNYYTVNRWKSRGKIHWNTDIQQEPQFERRSVQIQEESLARSEYYNPGELQHFVGNNRLLTQIDKTEKENQGFGG
eukprot:367706_1